MGILSDKNYIGYKECPKCKGDMKLTVGGDWKCLHCNYSGKAALTKPAK